MHTHTALTLDELGRVDLETLTEEDREAFAYHARKFKDLFLMRKWRVVLFGSCRTGGVDTIEILMFAGVHEFVTIEIPADSPNRQAYTLTRFGHSIEADLSRIIDALDGGRIPAQTQTPARWGR